MIGERDEPLSEAEVEKLNSIYQEADDMGDAMLDPLGPDRRKHLLFCLVAMKFLSQAFNIPDDTFIDDLAAMTSQELLEMATVN